MQPKPTPGGIDVPSPLPLGDLFLPPRSATLPTARSVVEQRLPPALAQQLAAGLASTGWQADALCSAAWLWLRRNWLASAPAGAEASHSVTQWLQELAANRPDWATPDGDALRWTLQLDGDATLQLDHDAALLDAAQAQLLLDSVLHVATQFIASPERRLDSVELVSAAQRQLQFEQWNPPIAAPDPRGTVHGCFAQIASKHADTIALQHGDHRLSYRALLERADALAARLQAAGVQPGDRVGIALERSFDATAALLAILRCGAAYVPLDTQYPPERLAFLVDDADVRVVLCSRGESAMLPASLARLHIEDLHSDATLSPAPVAVDADSVAYVMYTSGSTGTPKGIEICHRSILRLVIDAHYVDLPGRAMLHAAPLGFDASTLEIWGPLLNGGRCVLHDEALPTPAGLARTIRDGRVDAAWLTAALFNAVVDDDPAHLAGLRQLLIGGEALSVAHVRRALQALPGLTLINGYGPTECTTFSTTHRIPHDLPADARSVPIGRPINATRAYVLSPTLQPLPAGLVGELFIGGPGLARGYLKRPALNAERFLPDPFGAEGERLYRTGDRVRFGPEGAIEFVGRADAQVKIRGFRIELGEIEAALATHPAVRACAVAAPLENGNASRLVAYVVSHGRAPSAAALREHLSTRLPEFMQPNTWVWLDALPITTNGKLDRRALPAPPTVRPELATPFEAAQGPLEQAVCEAFAAVLKLDAAGRHDNFFELGGTSLQVLRVIAALQRGGHGALSTSAFLRLPTPVALARELGGKAGETQDDRRIAARTSAHDDPIAIIGMAGRFPGAADVEQFWDNLCAGRDGIRHFRIDELDPSLPAALTGDPCYVKARGVIDGADLFDAGFFGISPREAELMDPQQRVFLELCWHALEHAGQAPDACSVPVGVFAGMHNATYFQQHVSRHPQRVEAFGEFQAMLANEKDYIATRVANRLDLTGPAISMNTACSTSLVAVAQAVASLRAGQCGMALAGGSSIHCPPNSGYLHQEGAILSPDAKTRSFDARAAGTVFSDGAAVVVLKRLSDALADGDTVHALIRGAAVNNDGRDKASFTAPNAVGQEAVIVAAQRDAGVDARSISYVETHGTATPMGDPIEIDGLTRAFRRGTPDTGFCRIGSLKSNVGHMVIAAGAAGVIKTALSLAREQLPPSIHFDTPHPAIDFAASPFTVNTTLAAWPRAAQPRRAGVSAFGIGGTNAHLILEEAPLAEVLPAGHGTQWLQLSARTRASLDAMAGQLADHLEAHPAADLADVAHTLRVGRSRFAERLVVRAASSAEAIAGLRGADGSVRAIGKAVAAAPALVWMFTGQGSQYAGMGRKLHAADPAFREAFDAAAAALRPWLGFDIAERMFGGSDALAETGTTQPALFCLEFALARAWQVRGAVPAALLGHSIGEFAAAVIAGVMTLADAARLVARRGALMQALPPGRMLSVRLAAEQLLPLLPEGLSLAAENGPAACVVAGPAAAIDACAADFESRGIAVRVLHTSHAFHSAQMEPAVEPFEAEVRQVRLAAPTIPIVSTMTGTWLRDDEARDPHYWARHLREPVRFAPALRCARDRQPAVFVELGPRGMLTALARQQSCAAVASLADAPEAEAERFALAQAELWAFGHELPFSTTSATRRRRVPLPGYAFERKRHWLDAVPSSVPAREATTTMTATPSAPVIAPAIAPAAAVSRRPQLLNRLRTVFEDVAGVDLQQADGSMDFLQLGLDSLTLTQAALQVKRQFGVAVTFRQLMESLRSLDALAQHLDEALPPEAAPAVAAAPIVAAAAPVTTVAPIAAASAFVMPQTIVGATANPQLQQLIQQQMQLMSQQLALLGGMAATPAITPAATTPVAEPQAPAVAAPAAAAASPSPAADEPAKPISYDVKKAFGAIARIHTQANSITERQQARLDAFMRRYIERTAKSKAYTVTHRPHLADPRVVNGFRPLLKEMIYQIVIERSKGSRMWDLDGNEYVDVLNGFGMNLFGWQPDFVQDAVRAQLDSGYDIGPQHPLAGEVAQLICEMTGFDRAGLCNTGSEAVMAAIRMARTVTGRNTVVLFTGSYHGTFDEVLVRAGRGGKGIPAAPGIMPGVFGDVRVLEYGTPEALEFIRSNADDLAAVLVEVVQSRRPDFRPVAFLKELREITTKSGSCLIFDEVITGFRSHPGGVQALFDIRADLACYGKVIGGGFPVGVVAGKREFMDALDGGAWQYGDDSVPTVGVTYFAGTFVRHPLALAAAKASLLHLKQAGPALQANLNALTGAFADELNAFCREVGAPLEIRHFASLWRVSWLEDHPLQDLLFAMMRSRGVHILDNFPCFMTTAHSAADIAVIKSAFRESIAELQQAEFLPRRADMPAAVDASKPPVPGARLGRGPDGKPQWFVPNPQQPGKFIAVS